MSKVRSAGIAIVVAGITVAGVAASSSSRLVDGAQRPAAAPPFVQPGLCYRIAFPIDGAPNYKVLELLDGGWLKAEVDAGPGKAQRQPLWVNTAQIITMREARCSE